MVEEFTIHVSAESPSMHYNGRTPLEVLISFLENSGGCIQYDEIKDSTGKVVCTSVIIL